MKINDTVMMKKGSHFGEIGTVINLTADGWVQVSLGEVAIWVSKKAVKKI